MSVSGLKGSKFLPLDISGDGTGSIDMAVNGSITPVIFFRKPPVGTTYQIAKAVIMATSANWNNADEYGAAGTLVNGIRVYVNNDAGDMNEFTAEHRIIDWTHWSLLVGSSSIVSGGTGSDALIVEWTFDSPIELVGDQGDFIAISVHDDLSGLTYQHGVLQLVAHPS